MLLLLGSGLVSVTKRDASEPDAVWEQRLQYVLREPPTEHRIAVSYEKILNVADYFRDVPKPAAPSPFGLEAS